jgi:hypothetical protein
MRGPPRPPEARRPADRLVFQFAGVGPEDMTVSVVLPGDFPHEDLLVLGPVLEDAGVLTPGYGPPSIGLCHPEGFLYEQSVEHRETILLPDRNIVSRWARIAKGAPADNASRLAAGVLAFAQCLEIKVEPSVAFHELASGQSNDSANEEIAWFRAADNGVPRQWLDYALGRIDTLPAALRPHALTNHDLAYPLRRWRRNYAVALKIGQLELDGMPPLQRMLGLLDWMEHEFIVGPAGLMACLYFAPHSPPRKGLLKQLKSADRTRALAGARNVAWDITYLSDFVRRANEAEGKPVRYLFATMDKSLQLLAAGLFEYGGDGFRPEILRRDLARWWPSADAQAIAARMNALFDVAAASVDSPREGRAADFVTDAITRGEHALMSFRP